MVNSSSPCFRFYYLAGLPLLAILILLFSGNLYVALAMLALALVVDGACFALVFLTTGRSMQSLRTPYRQLSYLFVFLVLAVFPTIVFAMGISFTEILNRPFLGIESLSGRTFDSGTITTVGFVIVAGQAFLSALILLIPRELLKLFCVVFNREE